MKRSLGRKIFFPLLLLCANLSFAQTDVVKEIRHYDYCADILGASNQLYRMVIACNTGRLTTWKDILVTDTRKATAIALNPSGSNFVIATDKFDLEVWSLEKRNIQYAKLKGHTAPVRTLDYSRDTRYFLSAGEDKTLKIWDAKEFKLFRNLPCLMPVKAACFSPNGYFIACDQGNDIVIFNFEKTIAVMGLSGHKLPLRKLKFTDDGKYLMSLDEGGNVIVWNITDGRIYRQMKISGEVRDADIHHNNKYLATVDSVGHLSIWNLKKEELVQTLPLQKTGKTVHFSYDYDKKKALLVNCDLRYCYLWEIVRLEPAFDVLAARMTEERMDKWSSKRLGESSGEYEKRVNDSLQQKRVEAMRQAVTELGLKWRPLGKPERSEYLEKYAGYVLTFPQLKPFVLRVYAEDRTNFEKDFDKCEFLNPVYALDERDEFSLDYVEVYDPIQKKKHYFDNIQLRPQEQPKAVSKEIVRQVGEEEMILKRKLQDFFAKEMAEQKISDNIRVSVEARPKESIGENGEAVVDYYIDYSYEVLKTEKKNVGDWAPGRYLLNESNAATASVNVIQETFENELAPYIAPGKRVTVKVTGSADGSPIVGTIKYTGLYGNFDEVPYYLNGNMDHISVSSKGGISTNSQLAFLRTYGVRHFIEQNIPALQKTNNLFEHHVFVSEERGQEHRRVSIKIVIHDAFRK